MNKCIKNNVPFHQIKRYLIYDWWVTIKSDYHKILIYHFSIYRICKWFWRTGFHLLTMPFFLPEASFGLRVLSLPASVCPCVRVCVNHGLVRTITHHSFKLESPNLEQRCKRPWLRSRLFLGMIDFDLQGQIELESQILPHFELVRPITHQPFKLESPNLDRKCILALLRSLLILDMIGFDLHLHFWILKPKPLFLYYIKWDPSIVNISETIPGDGSNQFGLLTEHKFCRKLSRSISMDSRYCNRFINLGRLIFPLNHSGASVGTVFTIPTTFGIAHVGCYTRTERATKFATRVGSSLLDSFTVPSTHYVHKIVCTFSLICRACTNSIAIYLIIMRDFIFLCIGPHQQSAISSGWLW